MTRCDRLDRERWLVGDDASDPSERSERDAHLRECAECRAGWDAYAAIAGALPRLGVDFSRAPDADARLMARIARHESRRRRRWVVWLGAPLAAAACALALFVWWPRGSGGLSGTRTLEVAVLSPVGPSADPLRSDNPGVGDRLRVTAPTPTASHAVVRVYRNDAELLASCPGDSRCTAGDGALTLELTLDTMGRYQILWLASDRPLPASAGSLTRDLSAAAADGADYQLRDLEVR